LHCTGYDYRCNNRYRNFSRSFSDTLHAHPVVLASTLNIIDPCLYDLYMYLCCVCGWVGVCVWACVCVLEPDSVLPRPGQWLDYNGISHIIRSSKWREKHWNPSVVLLYLYICQEIKNFVSQREEVKQKIVLYVPSVSLREFLKYNNIYKIIICFNDIVTFYKLYIIPNHKRLNKRHTQHCSIC